MLISIFACVKGIPGVKSYHSLSREVVLDQHSSLGAKLAAHLQCRLVSLLVVLQGMMIERQDNRPAFVRSRIQSQPRVVSCTGPPSRVLLFPGRTAGFSEVARMIGTAAPVLS